MAILAQCPTCLTKQKVNNKGVRCGEDLDIGQEGEPGSILGLLLSAGLKEPAGACGLQHQ